MSKYNELKALAEQATKGPWYCSDRPHGEWWHIGSEHTVGGKHCENGRQAIATACAANKKSNPAYAAMFEANARFIAAANPAVILELIAESERLQAEVQEAKHEVEILEREIAEYEGHSLLLDAVCYRLGRDVGEGMFGPSRLQRTFLLCHGNAVRLLNLLTKRGKLEQVEDGGCMRRVAGKGVQANV